MRCNGHYSERILKLIDLYWKKKIGEKSVYALSIKEREETFNFVCNKVSRKINRFYNTYGEKRTIATFGEPIAFCCIFCLGYER